LAVFTVTEPGTHYYAVTVSINGREAIVSFHDGENRTGAVEEITGRFPAIVHQRTDTSAHKGQAFVDTYVFWAEKPYANVPLPLEIFLRRWPDVPRGSATKRLPLYVNLGTYGTTATEMASPGWHGARRYVVSAFSIGLAEEGTLWSGQHGCIA